MTATPSKYQRQGLENLLLMDRKANICVKGVKSFCDPSCQCTARRSGQMQMGLLQMCLHSPCRYPARYMLPRPVGQPSDTHRMLLGRPAAALQTAVDSTRVKSAVRGRKRYTT